MGVQRGSSLKRRPFAGRTRETGCRAHRVRPHPADPHHPDAGHGRLRPAHPDPADHQQRQPRGREHRLPADRSWTPASPHAHGIREAAGPGGPRREDHRHPGQGGQSAGAEPDDHHADQPGPLGGAARSARASPNLGSRSMYDHLLYNETNQTRGHLGSHRGGGVLQVQPITPLPNFIRGMLLPDTRRHDRLEQGDLLGPHEATHPVPQRKAADGEKECANEEAQEGRDRDRPDRVRPVPVHPARLLRPGHGGGALVHGPRRALEERGRRGAGGREEHLQPVRPQPRTLWPRSSPRPTSRAATWARPAQAPAP